MADGYRYYLDAGGKLLNTDVPLPAGYYLDEQGRLIDGNTYGNEIVIDTGSAADPSRTPLAGLRDQLHLGEADINNAAELFDVNRTMFSANYDKWDLYNACFLEVPENRALLYMLSGEVPTGGVFVDTKSQFAADTMEQTADALRGFLNSFDWKNASEMERAKKALDFCRQAQYDWDTFIGKNSVTDPGISCRLTIRSGARTALWAACATSCVSARGMRTPMPCSAHDGDGGTLYRPGAAGAGLEPDLVGASAASGGRRARVL